jgi:hypothetical protein
MPSFDKSGLTSPRATFGKNQFLRSTKGVKTESYTLSAASVATETIDTGSTNQKFVQAGELMAKITSTAEAGKIGPYDSTAADGRQTAANIVGFIDTFVPWTLNERDVDVAVIYDAAIVQANCFERNAGARIALTNTTRDLVVANVPTRLIRFS